MSTTTDTTMGQSPSYQGYLARYVLYFIRCPTKGRPKDCIHQCPRYFHSGACEPCKQFVELECYCEATGIVKPCKEWCDMQEEQKQLVKCCRGRCAKILECGHQCPRICHPGRCANPKECVENVIRYCSCERIERVFPCRGCGAKDQEVPCDQICAQLLQRYRQAIAEMKNNPVKLTNEIGHNEMSNSEEQTDENDGSVEAVTRIDDRKCAVTEANLSQNTDITKQESETESGFNEDKTEGDNRTDADSDEQQQASVEAAVESVEGQIEITASNEHVENSPQPEIASVEQQSTTPAVVAVDDAQDDNCERSELCASPHSDESSSRRSLQRVSRSSSRVSNYSEEDIPRQLDQEKIVKIMRSSTRRKKLIKCEQDIINEMQTS